MRKRAPLNSVSPTFLCKALCISADDHLVVAGQRFAFDNLEAADGKFIKL
jgi:hypothetical protein